MAPTALDRLVDQAAAGGVRAAGRLISAIEDDAPVRRELAARLAPVTGRAHVVGLTGAPGVGKSSTVAGLVGLFREAGRRVGVLALDPSSPFTGGALLGDRVRMQRFATDDKVFIRSMSSRGALGGLSAAAPQALRVFDLIGCDVVLVETVGVGQSEVDVVDASDTTVVLLAPGMGDGVQAAKAGVLEIADLFCVNKADRDGAQAVVRELRTTVALTSRAPGQWKPPVLTTVAATGEGLPALVEALDRHRAHAEADGTRGRRRVRRARVEVEALVVGTLRARWSRGQTGLDALAAEVAAGRLDPYAAADTVLARS
ncbi:LAO/AO transport system kinase [Friedmanniella endophytica]|uniref:LAO/AO transport system kinase n=1 Tax=Microlunatus kandeliicorticis TaxID=1759536 RepID=A0A7W3P717_9ACTN|nr:methylmalonyl Co-A mutase-associated GTPase MeaB [Microlunatus kandeliicorticis]MBA8795522.1 LAO/AO transport system kinase [Microlunatus kandeliicorticis]